LDILSNFGEYVVYGNTGPNFQLPFYQLLSKNLQLRFFLVYSLSPQDCARAIDTLMLMLEQDQLQHNIGARMSLDDIVQAHEMVERGEVTGNLVLKV
jgi:NADPH2:quinone reductase